MDRKKIDNDAASVKAAQARQQARGLIAALRWTAWKFDGAPLVRLEQTSSWKRAA